MRTATSPCRSTALRMPGAVSSTGPERSAEATTELGELLAHAHRGGAAAAGAGRDRALDGEHLADTGRERRVDLGELLVAEIGELDAELLAAAYARAGDLVGDAERHALAHQPLGDVGGEREALRGELGHPVAVVGERRDHPGERRQQHLEGVDG